MKTAVLTSIVVCLFLSGGVTAALASTETVQFTVEATTGSLSGTSASGSFSFDSSIIPVGGGEVDAVGLLTGLSFTWDGISYTTATANTGMLMFDASGALVGAIFGNNCFPHGCEVDQFNEEWSVEWLVQNPLFPYPDFAIFDYARPNEVGVQSGTLSFSPVSVSSVPEPPTAELLGAGGLLLVGLNFRRLLRMPC